MTTPAFKSTGVVATCSTKGEAGIRYVIHAESAADLAKVMAELGFRGVTADSFTPADVFIFPPAKPVTPV